MMQAVLILSVTFAFGLGPVLAADLAGQNTTTVVLGDGPFVGTYTIDNQGCIYLKDRDLFGVTFKKFAHNPPMNTLEEAAIQVDRAGAAGANTGDVTVKFLAAGSDDPQDYSMSNVPLTVTRSVKGARLSFEGKTKTGLRIRVTATCDHTESY